MDETRSTLLDRVRDRNDSVAWGEFHALYAPLLYHYARSKGLRHEDAEEIRDQCLQVVVAKIPNFEYDKHKGGFKNWLRRVSSNKVVDLLRKRRHRIAASGELRAIKDDHDSPDEAWEKHWKNEHLKYCVEQVRGQISKHTYQAFYMLIFEGTSVEDICGQLGMRPNQVYQAKSRVLRRVRKAMAELDPDLQL